MGLEDKNFNHFNFYFEKPIFTWDLIVVFFIISEVLILFLSRHVNVKGLTF